MRGDAEGGGANRPCRCHGRKKAGIVAVVMAVQAGLPPLDFGHVKGRKKQEYIWVQYRRGWIMIMLHAPMEKIFTGVIERTLKRRLRA